MSNPVNKWIEAGVTHKEKKKRRLIVAGACTLGGALLLAIWWPLSIPLFVIAGVKVKNALTDKS